MILLTKRFIRNKQPCFLLLIRHNIYLFRIIYLLFFTPFLILLSIIIIIRANITCNVASA